jgi:1-acyl-sn-glycerol-3-phosphate acyltransferase
MGDHFYKLLQPVFSLFWHCHVLDKKNIPLQGPAVFVSNHLGSYAPIAVLSAFPVRLYPWVEYQVTDSKLCPEYLRKDFVEPELHLKPPLSQLMAWLISRACITVMKALQAIPVHKKSMKMAATWKRSIGLLKQNKLLIIFPENNLIPLNDVMNELDDGFVGLASIYYEKTRRVLSFIPVAVHKTAKAIKIGLPVSYDPEKEFSTERERIKSTLQNRILEMHSSLR